MTLTSVLGIGANGLAAASHGTTVTSQNITNAATKGYTRRLTDLESIPLSEGGGVRSKASTRVQDAFLERRSLASHAFSGETEARVRTLSVLDSVLSEDSGNIGAALDAFESALADLSAYPGERGARQVVLARATQLSQAFSRTADALTATRVDANGEITDTINGVNGKLTQIGALGSKIAATKAAGGDAGDLQDRRDQLVRDVASAIPVTVLHEDDGQITLLLAGSRALVSADGSVTKLAANLDPTSGDVRIYRTTAGAQEDITGLISSGRVGGLVSARDGALAQARTELDQLAFDISTAYNAVHSAGFGLDGATARNLFTPPSAVLGAAGAMRVSTDVADQPDWLAAATSAASVPGDNRNALALLALRDQAFAAGGTLTAQEAFSGIVASGGSAVQGALGDLDQADATLSQVEGLRQAMTGVSTDEEMISLMTYQRAYQASLRVIETADAMLQELMNMKR